MAKISVRDINLQTVVEFPGIWECLNNSDFNRVDFEAVKNDAGDERMKLPGGKE